MKRLATCSVLLALSACATTNVTDPTDDSLSTAIKCTFTKSCENHNTEKKLELDQANSDNQALTKKQAKAKADLAASEKKLSDLRADVSKLDEEIARLQDEAASAAAEADSIDPELEKTLTELDRLRAESRDLEFSVLKETIDVAEVEARKVELEQWRDQLEQVLSASM